MDDRKMIECATCGYPLLQEERTSLQEVKGKMVKPWVSLTDDEIPTFDYAAPQFLAEKKFAHAIEAKLKEKNT